MQNCIYFLFTINIVFFFQTITPFLLANQNGRVEWTILELLNFFGGDKSCFAQNPITLRRKKSWVTDSSFDFNRLNIGKNLFILSNHKINNF